MASSFFAGLLQNLCVFIEQVYNRGHVTMYRGPRISNLDMKTRGDGCPFFYGPSGFLELSRAIASRFASSMTLSRIFWALRILADLRWKTMVASSKCSLSIWRTRSRTISLNPCQSRYISVLMLQPAVTSEAAYADQPESAREKP